MKSDMHSDLIQVKTIHNFKDIVCNMLVVKVTYLEI